MKKLIWTMLLTLGIAGTTYAQDIDSDKNSTSRSGAEKTFDPDPSRINRKFWIDLGKGNQLRLELQDIDDLDKFMNIDSLLLVFINDMKPFRDSLSNLLASHRIDYVSDPSGKKKIRIQQFKPIGSSFVVDQGEPAALKLEQDTINIVLVSPPHPYPKWDKEMHHDRLTLIINQYQDIENYVTGGLNAKLRWLQQNLGSNWKTDNGRYVMVKDPTITSIAPKGKTISAPGPDYLASAATLSLGNYKNYFVSSFDVGINLNFKRPNQKTQIGIFWEPNFFFARNAQGHLQTYMNEFMVLSFLQEKTTGYNVIHELVTLSPTVSLAYLIRRKGDFYDKSTFRLGVGGLRFFDGGLVAEPCFYFNNFFKEVTPGLKMSIVF